MLRATPWHPLRFDVRNKIRPVGLKGNRSAALGMCLVGVIAIVFQLRSIYRQNKLYHNNAETVGILGDPSWKGHGIHNFTFIVDGEKVDGSSSANHYPQIGGEVPVYFCPSHPEISSMQSPHPIDRQDWVPVIVFSAFSTGTLIFAAFFSTPPKENP